MNRIKVWPHMTIIAVVVALISGLAVSLWMKSEQTASAEESPYAARIQRVDGEVAFSEALANADRRAEWIAASVNQPVSVGDRIYTRDDGRTSLAFSGRNFARLDPNTSLDVVSLGHRRTQLALRDGSAMFDVGYLAPNELFEVATPYGAVEFDRPGLYNLGFDNNGGVLVSVLSGLARVIGSGGSSDINKGEMLTLLGQTAELVLSRLNGDDAGRLINDYYQYQYPNSYDGRYRTYDAYLADPYYFDPYNRNVSYQYANPIIPGINDLDYYGDWQSVDGYGYAWRPRVDSGWVPYQQGQWINDYPYGPTWVSNEPWGYAPYHYGRWAYVNNQWFWVPDAVNATPVYAPALVAFVPLTDANQIGWVPLGPGDTYAPRYYDENWRPVYLTGTNIVPAQLVNLSVPGAVTVVPLDAFDRTINPRELRKIDRQILASVRPTLDPLTLTPLRNAVVNSAWGRGKIDLPPGIAKKLDDTPVFIGTDIREPQFRKDVAKSMRVERVSENAKSEKLKVKDARDAKQDVPDVQQAERGRKQEPGPIVLEAERTNKEAQRQVRQAEQQQRKDVRSTERVEQKAVPHAEGERVGNPVPQSPGSPKHEGKQPSPGHGQGGKGKGKGKP